MLRQCHPRRRRRQQHVQQRQQQPGRKPVKPALLQQQLKVNWNRQFRSEEGSE